MIITTTVKRDNTEAVSIYNTKTKRHTVKNGTNINGCTMTINCFLALLEATKKQAKLKGWSLVSEKENA